MSEDDFIFFEFDGEVMEKFGLPNMPLPARMKVLEKLMSEDSNITELADELIAYLELNPDETGKYIEVMLKIGYIAGMVRGQDGDHDGAARYFDAIHRLEPKNLDIARNLAFALINANRHEEAGSVFDDAIRILTKTKETSELWGDAVRHYAANLDDKKKAEKIFNLAMDVSPQSLAPIEGQN